VLTFLTCNQATLQLYSPTAARHADKYDAAISVYTAYNDSHWNARKISNWFASTRKYVAFCDVNHLIFITGLTHWSEISNLVDRLIVASASPQMTNHPWKGRGQVWHVNRLTFDGRQPYLWNGWSYSHQILYTGRLNKVLAGGWQTTL